MSSRPSESDSFWRLRTAFLAESQRLLPEVTWRETDDGSLVHPYETLGLAVHFEGNRFTVDHRRDGDCRHFDAWDPAPRISPDEIAEAAVVALTWIQELLVRRS